jgi:hypothetical protein
LPPVSLIPVAICHRRRWHQRQICCRIVDTGGNTSGTGGKICHGCRWRAAILPPELLTPVVHLEKIWNNPYIIFRGLGEGASWEKPEVKNLVTLSLLGKSDPTVNNKRPARRTWKRFYGERDWVTR